MQEKKLSNKQLQKKLDNVLIKAFKDKSYKEVYLADMGVLVSCTDDWAIVRRNFAQTVFNSITSDGYSKPYMYISQFIDTCLENEIAMKNKEGYLELGRLKLSDLSIHDKTIITIVERFIYNLTSPQFAIGTDALSIFDLNLQYYMLLAKSNILLDDSAKEMSIGDLYNGIIKSLRDFSTLINEDISDEKSTELYDKVKEIEDKAYEDINKLISDSGYTVNDTKILAGGEEKSEE